ncbi:MAG: helix-turn-helix domain-containing protein [Geobacteraceae bacterium]
MLRLRKEQGLSVHDLGRLSGIPYVNRLESGKKRAGKHVVIRLAEALNVDIAEFYRSPGKPAARSEQLLHIFETLSQEGQTLLIETAKSIAAYETRLKWRE